VFRSGTTAKPASGVRAAYRTALALSLCAWGPSLPHPCSAPYALTELPALDAEPR